MDSRHFLAIHRLISSDAQATSGRQPRNASKLNMSTTNEAAVQVLTNRSLFTSIAGFSSGVSYFVYQVKQLVCAQYETTYDPENVAPQDVELWQNAICSGDRRTLEALQVLPEVDVLGERVRKVFAGIMGYALTHTKDLELLERIDDDDNFPNENHRYLTKAENRAVGDQGDVEVVEWMLSREYSLSKFMEIGAASKCHLDLISLVHENLIDRSLSGYSVAVMTAAAANWHLDFIREW